MRAVVLRFIGTLLAGVTAVGYPLDIDEHLNVVSELYGLNGATCENTRQPVEQSLASLGKTIFESKALSGEGDTACATCHIEANGFADGLPLSVGVGGSGEGIDRMIEGTGTLVPRNSFTLVGRAHRDYQAYFWDGRIQNQDQTIISPFGSDLDPKFQSLLSVTAIIPILARDEFLGKLGMFDQSENVRQINDKYYADRYQAGTEVLRQTLRDPQTTDQALLLKAIEAAGIDIEAVTLADVGNALASFISMELNCRESPWQRYLNGNLAALTADQKQGALIFYGKGRCSACHSGALMSDFNYYSIGVPQGDFGPGIQGQDLGRAEITLRTEDRYKFRTPPLLAVSATAPYGHNGRFKTLREVVEFHLNPVDYFVKNGWSSDRERLRYGKILQQRSEILSYIDIDNTQDLDNLLDFLETL